MAECRTCVLSPRPTRKISLQARLPPKEALPVSQVQVDGTVLVGAGADPIEGPVEEVVMGSGSGVIQRMCH